jgi:ACS family sodium-dependent inorganic phosphate cotransporter
LCFFFFGTSLPEENSTITEEEKKYILENRSPYPCRHGTNTTTNIPLLRRQQQEQVSLNPHFQWKILFTSRSAWAIYVAHFCNNYGWYVLLGWIPQYFRQVLKINLGKNGISAAFPYICGYFGVLLFGKMSDYLIANGYRVLKIRQLMNGIAFFGSAFFLFVLRYATNTSMAIGFLSLTLFFGRASTTGYWINMIDIGPNHAGHIMGVSNTIATIPGIVGNIITGKILEATGDWDIVFMIASLILIFGGFFFHCNASDQSIYHRSTSNLFSPLKQDNDQDQKTALLSQTI